MKLYKSMSSLSRRCIENPTIRACKISNRLRCCNNMRIDLSGECRTHRTRGISVFCIKFKKKIVLTKNNEIVQLRECFSHRPIKAGLSNTRVLKINHSVSSPLISLTHCGLVTPYGGTDPGQHWLRYWHVAWRHQAISWTNVDWLSVQWYSYKGNFTRDASTINHWNPFQNYIYKISLKFPRGQWVLKHPRACFVVRYHRM